MITKTAACLLSLSAPLFAMPMFIGTGGGGGAKGIYIADFDADSGKLGVPVLAAEYKGPGFLDLHPEKPVLYAIGSPEEKIEGGYGSVAAWSIGKDQQLTFLGEASVGGENACHLAVDATGKAVAVANYGDGSLSTVGLDDAGVPVGPVSIVRNRGAGPHPRQKGPHAHGVYFDRSNELLYVPDLGLDKVLVYPFDAVTGELGQALEPLETAPGAGPRHMAFSPDGKHAYVINELDSSVLVADVKDGRLTPVQSVPTLPEGFDGQSTTAEVEVSEDGKFVYGSNRGLDTIVVYQRDAETGKLTYMQNAPCGGKTPRHFKIAPGGKWLLCGHQGSNSISVLPRDPETGKLGKPVRTVECPSPICLLFLP